MSDIVERLRAWVYTDSQYATAREAADEIERLRSRPCPYVTGRTTQYCTLPTTSLTPEEREAVAYYLGTGGPYNVDRTLVALLSRTGTDGAKTGDDAAGCRSQSEKHPERERVANHPEKPDSSTLTDAEQEAIEALIEDYEQDGEPASAGVVCTLRGLLERIGGER